MLGEGPGHMEEPSIGTLVTAPAEVPADSQNQLPDM